jgi:S1-C subfamily serine protease
VHALEVYANARSVVFAALGLEPGDRITVIDDVPVTDATAAIASLRRLTEGAALTVRVERGGGVATLALDGGIVVAARRRI